ncbi:hypothetical protein P3X46_006945 [Hevea brasiliensis]|uniref:F-box domain-containing protein n=1 Tax=Hevea brasiliensis TaxID=3981 RepID=A0ABQ9MVR4_HEVBR|nr:hypothetical protein P3X46_006945 [Hevea brasiliensis]
MDTNNQDMFIRLTNSLLVLIVSNLPFKGSARTSILSKQWLNIWRESTNLELNESSFVKLEENQEIQRIQRITFFDFVRHFIVSYPQKAIQKFAVACSKPKRFLSDMQNFVTFAISRNVKELEIDFSDPTWREDNLDNHPAVAELPLQGFQFHHPQGCFFRMDKDKYNFYQVLVGELSIAREFEFKEFAPLQLPGQNSTVPATDWAGSCVKHHLHLESFPLTLRTPKSIKRFVQFLSGKF